MKTLQTEAAVNKIFTPRCSAAASLWQCVIDGDIITHCSPAIPPSAQFVEGCRWPRRVSAALQQPRGLKTAKLMLCGAVKSQQAQLSYGVRRSTPAGCFKHTVQIRGRHRQEERCPAMMPGPACTWWWHQVSAGTSAGGSTVTISQLDKHTAAGGLLITQKPKLPSPCGD